MKGGRAREREVYVSIPRLGGTVVPPGNDGEWNELRGKWELNGME